jgi:hypothetical protein
VPPSQTTSPQDPSVTVVDALLGAEVPSFDVRLPLESTETRRAPTLVAKRYAWLLRFAGEVSTTVISNVMVDSHAPW